MKGSCVPGFESFSVTGSVVSSVFRSKPSSVMFEIQHGFLEHGQINGR